MEKYKYKDINTNREIPEGLIDGLKEAEKIAKEIGGHIPERVVDDGTLETPKFKQTVTIRLGEYRLLIEENGFLKGRNRELEKQIEQYNAPITLEEAEAIKNKEYTTIPKAEYIALIEQKSYAEGRIAELEKQLEEQKRPVETVKMYADGEHIKTVKRGEITD